MKNIDQLLAGNARLEEGRAALPTVEEIDMLGLLEIRHKRHLTPMAHMEDRIETLQSLVRKGWAYVANPKEWQITYRLTPEGQRVARKTEKLFLQREIDMMLAERARVKALIDADPIKDGYGYQRQVSGVTIRIGARIELNERTFGAMKATILPPEKYAYQPENVFIQLDGSGFMTSVMPNEFVILPDTDIAPAIETREVAAPMREEFAKLFAEAPV